jgi:hypothetical protein
VSDFDTQTAASFVPPERVREILTHLRVERDNLRRTSSDKAALEANRLSIVYWQSRLSDALTQEQSGALRPFAPSSVG